jgi:hypothetical protein
MQIVIYIYILSDKKHSWPLTTCQQARISKQPPGAVASARAAAAGLRQTDRATAKCGLFVRWLAAVSREKRSKPKRCACVLSSRICEVSNVVLVRLCLFIGHADQFI